MLFSAPPTIPSEIMDTIGKIDEIRTALAYALSGSTRWTGLLRRLATAQAVRASVGIEGHRVTVEDAIAAAEGTEPMDTSAENWQALRGYQRAMTYVLQLADDPHFSYDEGLTRSLHFMMLQDSPEKRPGKWRPGGIHITEQETGTVVYEAPDSDLVPGLMTELVASLRQPDTATPALIRAAMAHLDLAMIHPFMDGNGRMARCLQTLLLVREGTIDRHFCSIEEYLGRHTEEYYRVLASVGRGKWGPHSDTLEWIYFNVMAHARQAAMFRKRLSDIGELWNYLEAELKRLGLPDRMLSALSDAALGLRVRNSTYRTAAEINETLASRDLKVLVEAGLLEPHGNARGRVYTASPPLRTVWQRLASNVPEALKDY